MSRLWLILVLSVLASSATYEGTRAAGGDLQRCDKQGDVDPYRGTCSFGGERSTPKDSEKPERAANSLTPESKTRVSAVKKKKRIKRKEPRKRVIRVTPRMGGQGGLGEIDKSGVSRVMRMRSSTVKSCYVKALRTNSRLEGKLALKFVITMSGRVGSVSIKSNSLHSSVAKCVSTNLKNWRFPKPKKGTVSFNYSWIFSN